MSTNVKSMGRVLNSLLRARALGALGVLAAIGGGTTLVACSSAPVDSAAETNDALRFPVCKVGTNRNCTSDDTDCSPYEFLPPHKCPPPNIVCKCDPCGGDGEQCCNVGPACGTTLVCASDTITCQPRVASAIFAGANTTYAIKPNGDVWGWGSGENNALATVGTTNSPKLILSAHATAISAGPTGACALIADGTVSCWGLYSASTSTKLINTTPKTVLNKATGQPLRDVLSIAQGGTHNGSTFACALTSAKAIYCWGDNDQGQLGDFTDSGTEPYSAQAVQVVAALRDLSNIGGPVNDAVALAIGGNTACYLSSTTPAGPNAGLIWCWGDNSQGQSGSGTNGPAVNYASPQLAPGTNPNPPQTMLVGGGLGTFCSGPGTSSAQTPALNCWGVNSFGQTGLKDVAPAFAPSADGFASTPLAFGNETACHSGSPGSCWGNGLHGQLGDGASHNAITAPVPNTSISAGVALGDSHGCGLDTLGNVYCWGLDDQGQLGNRTTGSSSQIFAPTKITF